MTTGELDLAGQRVFVVEDESMVTMFIQDTLADLGCEVVGSASRLNEALTKLEALSLDVAILDANLNGQQTFPIAEALSKRGIPFLWATGYGTGGLPDSLRAPVLSKPFEQRDLERALRAALTARH